MDKTFIVTPSRCTGCRTCELACSMVKGSPDALARPRIHVLPVSPVSPILHDSYVQMTCLQCVEAACVTVCPTLALVRNKATGAIECDDERCIGCGLCHTACPFGHMYFCTKSGKAQKCDLCFGDPACAKFCPHGALEYR